MVTTLVAIWQVTACVDVSNDDLNKKGQSASINYFFSQFIFIVKADSHRERKTERSSITGLMPKWSQWLEQS